MAERDNSWDTLRALLMLLGIPFHAALPYSYSVNAVVLSEHPSLVAEFLGSVLHSFRMGSFFVVAGYFAAHAIARKGPAVWGAGRLPALAIPLLVGLVCFMPLLWSIRALDQADGAAAWPVLGELLAQPGRHWTGHLWFLIVLLQYCLLTALIWDRAKGALAAVGKRLTGQSAVLVAVMMVPLALAPRLVLAMLGLDQGAAATILEVQRLFEYAPFFALGLTLYMAPEFLVSFSRLDWRITVLALLACIAFAVCDHVGLLPLGIAAKAAAATLMCSVLLGLARRYFTRPRVVVRWLAGAAFSIYLFHFPIVCAAAYLLEPTSITAELRIAIIIVAALVLSCLAHLLLSRSAVLLLLFNGRPIAAPPRPSALPVPAQP